jgi:hypothetical protein
MSTELLSQRFQFTLWQLLKTDKVVAHRAQRWDVKPVAERRCRLPCLVVGVFFRSTKSQKRRAVRACARHLPAPGRILPQFNASIALHLWPEMATPSRFANFSKR